MNLISRIASVALLVSSLLLPCTVLTAYSGLQDSGKQTGPNSGAKKSSTRPLPSAQEIADAKAKGLVWVNLSTRVYHKGGPLYGNTKRGKFMSEEDAKKAGYRLATENNSSKTPGSSNPK